MAGVHCVQLREWVVVRDETGGVQCGVLFTSFQVRANQRGS